MDIKYGLAGVVIDQTAISKVMPEINSLTYRGYPVQELAAKCSFEEVAYLLFYGELPNKQELQEFCELEKQKRALSPQLKKLLELMPKTAHPMDLLRTVVSYIGCEQNSLVDNKNQALELLAILPSALGFFYRKRKGLKVNNPDASLCYIDNFFQLCFSELPEEAIKKAFNTSLILYAEHTFNASTFAARVITSTQSDIYSAITGAIACLKGPLHGGANEAVMHTMLEIGEPEKAADWLNEALEQKKKIMGFGHRVYRQGDSRVPSMKEAFLEVAAIKDGKKWVQIYQILEELMIEKKKIHPNLDFPAGPTYYLMGFDIDFFTPIFVMSRVTGWIAHIFEQQENNKLIRPSSHYIGKETRAVPELSAR